MELIDTNIVITIVAAFASLLGLIIPKEQKISDFRQAWVESLREEISSFMAEVDLLRRRIRLLEKNLENKEEIKTIIDDIFIETKATAIRSKIQLLINPRKESHREIVIRAEALLKSVVDRQDHKKPIQDLTEISQKVSKEEWDKVKAGELFYKATKWFFTCSFSSLLIYLILKLLHSNLHLGL